MKQKAIIPEKVSWRIVDAWLVMPPCTLSEEHAYCHVQCPYYHECNPEEKL